MSIIFSASGLSNLTFERGRGYPLSEPITINQERYLTEGNNAKVVDYGNDLTLIKVSINLVTKDQYDGAVNGLKTWFESSSINWAATSFTMLDEKGNSHTVRWWQGNFNMVEHANGRYAIQFTLKKES